MRMVDIIMRKRQGETLSEAEIRYFIEGYTKGEIPDYQAAALMMAIYFRGMDKRETVLLTDAMARSGDRVDLGAIEGVKADKHSTGGVGDKTSLIAGPIVAACGVPVAKMSGRGLGHTGGTLDKLEAIPGLRTDIGEERFFEIVRTVGLSIIGQTADIAPADKKLYALRDVTATVDNLSLIASSIMSKKLACGSDAILLDVKTGSGAFMKTLPDSIALAQAMVDIGEGMGRRTAALITGMDLPLGAAIGNALEVVEAVETLRGKGPADLTEVCLQIAANMLYLAGKGEMPQCLSSAKQALESGRAFEKLCGMVKAQGGDISVLEEPSRFAQAPFTQPVTAPAQGYITHMQTEQCGLCSVVLGAGREKKEDAIDPSAGILLRKKTGDYVEAGEEIAVLYTSHKESLPPAEKMLQQALAISQEKPQEEKLIIARVTKQGVQQY